MKIDPEMATLDDLSLKGHQLVNELNAAGRTGAFSIDHPSGGYMAQVSAYADRPEEAAKMIGAIIGQTVVLTLDSEAAQQEFLRLVGRTVENMKRDVRTGRMKDLKADIVKAHESHMDAAVKGEVSN